MKGRAFLCSFLCGAAGLSAQTTPPPSKVALPSADSVIQRSIEVTGGKAAFEAVHTEKSTGAFAIAGAGITGTITEYSADPGKSYSAVEISGVGKLEEGTTGTIAWENSALQGARILSGDEAAIALRKAASDVITNWRKYYVSAETTGVEAVDGKDCYKVVMTPKTGPPETDFYDKETGFLLKESSVANTPMGPIPGETTFSDYRKQGDVTLAFHVVEQIAGQQFDIKLTKIELNADVPDNRFDPPAEVKALMK